MKRPSSRAKSLSHSKAKHVSRSAVSGAYRGSRPSSARPATAKGSRAKVSPPPAGFTFGANGSRLLVPAPAPVSQPIPASKIRRGLADAKRQLDETLAEVLTTLTGAYEIKEIKLVASFSADGKFLGFGVGGAASMEITICPCDD